MLSEMKLELYDAEPRNESKRRLNRIKGDSKKVVLWGDTEQLEQGKVIDESFGGIGLRFDPRFQFEPGQELEVSYNGVQLWAVVRHVTADDTGKNHVGFEWKAAGLSRAARQTTVDDREDSELCRFKEALPSGLYMMWRLFECEKWFELGEKAECLRKLASKCDFADTVASVARELQEAIELEEPKEPCKQALQSLAEECIRVTGGGLDEFDEHS